MILKRGAHGAPLICGQLEVVGGVVVIVCHAIFSANTVNRFEKFFSQKMQFGAQMTIILSFENHAI